MDLLSISRDLIAADTVTHRGTEPAVRVLRPLFAEAGLEVKVQEVVHDRAHHQNLLGTYPGADAAGLVLTSHLDTPDSGPAEHWTETENDPYRLTRKDDRLYGLGAAGAKLAAVCQLLAARSFAGRPLSRALSLLCTFGAEGACDGTREALRHREPRARFAAVAAPTGLSLVTGHRGRLVVHVSLVVPETPELPGPFQHERYEGRDAEAPGFQWGQGALEKALAAVGDGPLASLEVGATLARGPMPCAVVRPSPASGQTGAVASPPDTRDARPTLALARRLFALWQGACEGHEPRTHVAFGVETCLPRWTAARLSGPRGELLFEARLLPGQDPDALSAAFARAAEGLAREAQAQVAPTPVLALPGFSQPEPSLLLDAARDAARERHLGDAPRALPVHSEAGLFAQAGVETLVFGPGPARGELPAYNEYNLLSHLEKAIEFYRALITRLCT